MFNLKTRTFEQLLNGKVIGTRSVRAASRAEARKMAEECCADFQRYAAEGVVYSFRFIN